MRLSTTAKYLLNRKTRNRRYFLSADKSPSLPSTNPTSPTFGRNMPALYSIPSGDPAKGLFYNGSAGSVPVGFCPCRFRGYKYRFCSIGTRESKRAEASMSGLMSAYSIFHILLVSTGTNSKLFLVLKNTYHILSVGCPSINQKSLSDFHSTSSL